jgi:aspartyl-tRNA(Asn)/glutamyl-tRNA(Gln) amidotransferase subunit C
MPLGEDEVRHVALLARLNLSEAEVGKYAEQLGAILDYMAELKQLDTTGVEPMISSASGRNVFRSDAAGAGLPREAFLSSAPSQDGEFFRVPPVIE